MPLGEQAKVVGGIPKADVFAAFDYYIKHYNNGRPFILAGHSQGSNVLVYFARDVADRVIFMDEGIIVEEAPPAEMFTKPQHPRTIEFLNKVLSAK